MIDDKYKPINLDGPFKQIIEKMEGLDFSKIDSITNYDLIKKRMQENIQKNDVDPIIPDGYFEKSQEYQQQSLEMLKSINQNTANLYTLVELISKSNDQQDEVIEIIADILAIAKAKEKEEAESLLKRVMTKINDSVEVTDSIIKLVGWATTIYQMVVTMLPK